MLPLFVKLLYTSCFAHRPGPDPGRPKLSNSYLHINSFLTLMIANYIVYGLAWAGTVYLAAQV